MPAEMPGSGRAGEARVRMRRAVATIEDDAYTKEIAQLDIEGVCDNTYPIEE